MGRASQKSTGKKGTKTEACAHDMKTKIQFGKQKNNARGITERQLKASSSSGKQNLRRLFLCGECNVRKRTLSYNKYTTLGMKPITKIRNSER
jgi:hypothetical protein